MVNDTELLGRRYGAISENFQSYSDFENAELEKSRKLFTFQDGVPHVRSFDTWTCLNGLPLPEQLTGHFTQVVDQIKNLLPAGVRFYAVRPQNYQWEACVIKWPEENVPLRQLRLVENLAAAALRDIPTFDLQYRGFLITPDGTVIAKGFGDVSRVRAALRTAIPFVSNRQSEIAHISLGRILDPVGESVFFELKDKIHASSDDEYGVLRVSELKYVHETRWYMEERDVIQTWPLR